MKLLLCSALVALGSLLPSSCAAEDDAPTGFPEPAVTPEHAWLQQLMGEWSITTTSTMAPANAPPELKGTESVHSIGGLWVVGEGQADMGDMPLHSMITLGYDPARKAFVGTWVDTSQAYMWVYEGHLDATRKILALDSKGPSPKDPTQMASWRDSIEIKDADHRTLTSEIRDPDGTWETMMRADYRRKP